MNNDVRRRLGRHKRGLSHFTLKRCSASKISLCIISKKHEIVLLDAKGVVEWGASTLEGSRIPRNTRFIHPGEKTSSRPAKLRPLSLVKPALNARCI
jgi:hypothetical protein